MAYFDTHEEIQYLKDAGVPEQEAAAIVRLHAKKGEDLATKSDLKLEIFALKSELKEEISELKNELKEDISKLRNSMDKIDVNLNWAKALGVACVFLLIKVAFY